jgi:hypothetical protein
MGPGPGIPEPPEHRVLLTNSAPGRHQLGGFARLRVKSILSGFHHEYDLVAKVTEGVRFSEGVEVQKTAAMNRRSEPSRIGA